METVYIETSVISYLTARPSRNAVVAVHQTQTREWWTRFRTRFELCLSQAVLLEIGRGDPVAAATRLELARDLRLLQISNEATALARRIIVECGLPEHAGLDALHVATAATNQIDYLLTWNCKHIANSTLQSRIAAACRSAGRTAPVLCTPSTFLED